MPHLATYLGLADHGEQVLAESLREVAAGHAHVADVHHLALTLAGRCEHHRELLAPVVARYGEQPGLEEPDRLRAAALPGTRAGEVGLLRDLQDLHVLADLVRTTWTVLAQCAQGARDRDLLTVARDAGRGTERVLAWLDTRIKAAAPQALLVDPPA